MFRLPASVSRLPALVLIATLAPPVDVYQATREAFLQQINNARTAAGLHPLSLSEALSAVAQERAVQISARKGRPAPAAEETSGRALARGYEAWTLSEILAKADGNPASIVGRWTSPGNSLAPEILGALYREMGLGVVFSQETPIYVLLLSLSWADFFVDATRSLRDPEAWRRQMLAAVNRERAAKGVPPLHQDARLDRAAQAHAEDMLSRAYYAHDSPDGKNVLARVRHSGYGAREAAENIARGQYSVDEVVKGWMESPHHREHLLSPVFSDVGFGLAFGKSSGGYTILWVQDFGKRP